MKKTTKVQGFLLSLSAPTGLSVRLFRPKQIAEKATEHQEEIQEESYADRQRAGKVCRDACRSVSRRVFLKRPHPTRSAAPHVINYLLCDRGLTSSQRHPRGVPA